MKRSRIPNLITICRIAMMPLFVAFFWAPFAYHTLVAGLVFAVAAITDVMDGAVARKVGAVSDMGKFLDPIADKILMGCSAVCVLAAGLNWTMWSGALMLCVMFVREFAVAGLRMLAADRGHVLAADMCGKVKTVLVNVAMSILIIAAQWPHSQPFATVTHHLGNAIWALAVVVSVVSGIHYFVRNHHVLSDRHPDDASQA